MPHDIYISRDAKFRQPCQWKTVASAVVNITGMTVVANVKSYPARATVNLAPSVEIVTAASGLFDVVFTAAQVTALVKERYVWEVLVTSGAVVQRILSGTLRVRDTGDDTIIPVLQVAIQDTIA